MPHQKCEFHVISSGLLWRLFSVRTQDAERATHRAIGCSKTKSWCQACTMVPMVYSAGIWARRASMLAFLHTALVPVAPRRLFTKKSSTSLWRAWLPLWRRRWLRGTYGSSCNAWLLMQIEKGLELGASLRRPVFCSCIWSEGMACEIDWVAIGWVTMSRGRDYYLLTWLCTRTGWPLPFFYNWTTPSVVTPKLFKKESDAGKVLIRIHVTFPKEEMQTVESIPHIN